MAAMNDGFDMPDKLIRCLRRVISKILTCFFDFYVLEDPSAMSKSQSIKKKKKKLYELLQLVLLIERIIARVNVFEIKICIVNIDGDINTEILNVTKLFTRK